MFIWITWIKEVIRSLFSNFFYNFILVFISIVCLGVFAIVFTVGLNANKASDKLDEQLEVSLYVKNEITNYGDIEDRLRQEKDVKNVQFISRDKAFAIMEEELGDEKEMLYDLDGINPFNAKYVITLDDPTQIRLFAERIEKWEIHDEILYSSKIVDSVLSGTETARKIIYGVVIATVIITVIIISGLIKFNIQSRQKEIEIKQLVGSSMLTIRLPFILEAVILTGLASGAVWISFFYGYDFLIDKLPNMVKSDEILISSRTLMDMLTIPLFSIAVIIGFVGSFFSTIRFISTK